MRVKVLVAILLTFFGFLLLTPNASSAPGVDGATRTVALLSAVRFAGDVTAQDPVVPKYCVGSHDIERFRNFNGLYDGGGACSRCFDFGAFGIYMTWWDDFQCWMSAGPNPLLVQLWTHSPGNP